MSVIYNAFVGNHMEVLAVIRERVLWWNVCVAGVGKQRICVCMYVYIIRVHVFIVIKMFMWISVDTVSCDRVLAGVLSSWTQLLSQTESVALCQASVRRLGNKHWKRACSGWRVRKLVLLFSIVSMETYNISFFRLRFRGWEISMLVGKDCYWQYYGFLLTVS
jgi:hypothetical protein